MKSNENKIEDHVGISMEEVNVFKSNSTSVLEREVNYFIDMNKNNIDVIRIETTDYGRQKQFNRFEKVIYFNKLNDKELSKISY